MRSFEVSEVGFWHSYAIYRMMPFSLTLRDP